MKHINTARKYFSPSVSKIGTGASLALVSAASFAQDAGADYTSITASVDWSQVTVGVLAVGAALAGVLVAKRGARVLLGMIGR